ncbi:unnamed protein product [Strongylus vulgaris]|uniref:Uncharacterized protein n=1 Tax=Strongylus vulgaris TaxID=40348 RepID=A0A3P7LA35_STRVU|nr:unnamed protein product [Strongylus vulgaris]
MRICQDSLTPITSSFLIGDFKARPIPEFAKRLKGQALVDYINKAQPFFKVIVNFNIAIHTVIAAKLPSMSYEQLKSRIMDWKYIETPDPVIRGKAPDLKTKIPERCRSVNKKN